MLVWEVTDTMILFGNILYALAKIVELADGLLTVYKYILIARP
jgi:YggT family protein